MSLLFVCSEAWPYPTGNGSAVLTHGLLESVLKLGFSPVVVPVLTNTPADKAAARRKYLEDRGIPVVALPELNSTRRRRRTTRARRALLPTNAELIPSQQGLQRTLRDVANAYDCRAVLAYGWQSLGLVHNMRGLYKIASIVDLFHDHFEARRRRLRAAPVKEKLLGTASLVHFKRTERLGMRYLKDFDLIIEHAAHHAEDLRALGYENVHCTGHPLSPQTEDIINRINRPTPAETTTVLIVGSFKGGASNLGFKYFLDELWPAWERVSAETRRAFRFRFVGHGEMPPATKARLSSLPGVEVVGFADDLLAEYEQADILLVTIPARTGFRTRIAEAFSYGMCVVAHDANCAGMPEIIDNRNALVSGDAGGLVERLVRAGHDQALRQRLRGAALQTFQTAYSIDAATNRLAEWLPQVLLHQVNPRPRL